MYSLYAPPPFYVQEDRAVNNPVPDRGGNGLALGDDRFKPVVPWPHVEGVEIGLGVYSKKEQGQT